MLYIPHHKSYNRSKNSYKPHWPLFSALYTPLAFLCHLQQSNRQKRNMHSRHSRRRKKTIRKMAHPGRSGFGSWKKCETRECANYKPFVQEDWTHIRSKRLNHVYKMASQNCCFTCQHTHIPTDTDKLHAMLPFALTSVQLHKPQTYSSGIKPYILLCMKFN